MINVGDKVTIISGGNLLPTIVCAVCADGFHCDSKSKWSIECKYADEGRKWIRGHHTAASKKGKALLAPAALAPAPPMRKLPFSDVSLAVSASGIPIRHIRADAFEFKFKLK